MSAEESERTIETADAVGGVVVPAVVSAGYGIYRLVLVDAHSTNGLILTILSLLSLVSAWLFKVRGAVVAPWLLGWYIFGILGCAGLGLAIAERSGFRVAAAAAFWLIFGWYALSRVSRFRRFTRAARSFPRAGKELQ